MKKVKRVKMPKTLVEWVLWILVIALGAVFVTAIAVALGFAETASAEEFYWKNAGGNPFGDRDVNRAIKKFNLPEEVKKVFIEHASTGGVVYLMKKGQFLEEMASANYHIIGSVTVFLPEKDLMARIYPSVKYDGYEYFLIKPVACNNWAWWKEVVNQSVFNRHFDFKEKKVELVEAVEAQEEPEEPILIQELEPKKFYENETCIWSGGSEKNFFLGGNHKSFFFEQPVFDGRLQEGIGLSVGMWQGKTEKDFWHGNSVSVGPVVKFITPRKKYLSASAQIGERDDQTEKNVSMLYLSGSYWTKKLGLWGDVSFNDDHSKSFGAGGRYYIIPKAGVMAKRSYSSTNAWHDAWTFVGIFVVPVRGMSVSLEQGQNKKGVKKTNIVADYCW
ncbi:MAG: hypothetical protein Q7T79_03175 [bacterium]|nr:hypothetical protein [bacterium]